MYYSFEMPNGNTEFLKQVLRESANFPVQRHSNGIISLLASKRISPKEPECLARQAVET